MGIYGADEYLETLARKYEQYDELVTLLEAAPDAAYVDKQDPAKIASKKTTAGEGAMLKHEVDENKRSKKTQRAIPTPNIPEPMPKELAFMFTKISPEQKMYMWNIYTMIFSLQCLDVVLYWAMLRCGIDWGIATAVYGVLMLIL